MRLSVFALFCCLAAPRAWAGSIPPVSSIVTEPPAEIAADGLDASLLSLAQKAYAKVDHRKSVLTVIDYSKPSTEKRLWVIDMDSKKVLFHELVAHGRGSGENLAIAFGNGGGSHRSSLGVFRTAETYDGKHGYSLKLDGLERGVNDAARERSIVVHAADYVTPEFAKQNGRLGRSHGCPALDPKVATSVIDAIKDGSVLVVFGNDDAWLASSELLK